MSYETDVMSHLTRALNDTFALQASLKQFNKNAEVLKEIAEQLKRMNDLKEQELRMKAKQELNGTGYQVYSSKIK